MLFGFVVLTAGFEAGGRGGITGSVGVGGTTTGASGIVGEDFCFFVVCVACPSLFAFCRSGDLAAFLWLEPGGEAAATSG